MMVEGSGDAAGVEINQSRHRAYGMGMGDVCRRPSGQLTSGFSHGCRSRLLVLDGPVSRVLEGVLAGDLAGAPPLTGPEVRMI